MVAVGFGSYYAGLIHTELPPLLSFMSFTLNLYIAENGYNFLFFLVFLWSISVEEQFYIFWGMTLNTASKINAKFFQYSIPITACFLIAISLWYRYTHCEDELKLYFHTLSVTANFGIGIWVAYLSAYSKWFIPLLQRMSKLSILLLFIILLLSVLTYTIVFTHPFAILFERVYFSFLFAIIIAVLCYSSIIPTWQKFFNPFDYLGKIALGLYFYHGIVITIFSKLMMQYSIADKSWQVMLLNPLIMLTLSIICASISYNYFEKPILALKNKFYRHLKSAA
jgi:peptidoglycan/LPS O-acetylase OafA/YrhL